MESNADVRIFLPEPAIQYIKHTYHTRILFLKNTYVFLRILFYHTRILELWPFRWVKIRLLKLIKQQIVM